MNILICGAGEVGSYSAEVLAPKGNNITVVDSTSERLRLIEEKFDVSTLVGDCAHAETLLEAGAAEADLVLLATSRDEVNLLGASLAKGLGAQKVIARVHQATYFENRGLNYQDYLRIDQLICPEYSAAQAIARTLRNPGAMAIEDFARGQIEMQEFRVKPNARSIDKRLKELTLPTGVRLAAVTRNGYSFIPDANTVITADDVIVLVGNTDVFSQATRLFTAESSRRQRTVLFGGRDIAVWLCRMLEGGNASIRLFETDRAIAEELAEVLDWVTVINADPTDPVTFDEEHLEQTDAFVALADDDEQNILSCAWAKSMGAAQAIAVVQRQSYVHLLPHVHIDKAFSPRRVAVREIENVIDQSPLRRVASLAEGDVDVFQARVGEGAPVIDRPLRTVKLTPDWMVAAVQNESSVFVPTADDALSKGDTALLIGRSGTEDRIRKLFVGEANGRRRYGR